MFTNKRNAISRLILISTCLVLLSQCATSKNSYPLGKNLLVPLGRSFLGNSEIDIFLDGREYQYEIFYDGYGGFWAKIDTDGLNGETIIKILYTRRKDETSSFVRDEDRPEDWINPARFIDSDDPKIRDAAAGIYDPAKTREQNAKAIAAFVCGHLLFDMGFSRDPASIPASKSLDQKIGVCINFARLFIAICRTSGIPARSVSGIVQSKELPEQYDFHHEWAEFMDEDGRWRALDMTYTNKFDLSDICYTDLVFAAEDNPYFAGINNQSLVSGQPVSLSNGDLILFHYHPIFPGAHYGFTLVDDGSPEYFVLEKTLAVRKDGSRVIVNHLN